MRTCLDIEREKKIIELLGYNIFKLGNSKNFIICDYKGEKIGFIECRASNRNEDKNEYYTEINSDIVKVKSGVVEPMILGGKPVFNIFFKGNEKNNYESGNIYIHIGPDFTGIDLHDNNNRRLILEIRPNSISMLCRVPFNWYIEECIFVDYSEGLYTYELSFNDIRDIDNMSFNKLNLKCKRDSENSKLLNIENTQCKSKFYDSKEDKREYISIVEGNLEDAIKKHEMGIDSFSHFRYLINLQPFKAEIISWLIKNSEFNLPPLLDIFVPDMEDEIKKKQLKLNNQ